MQMTGLKILFVRIDKCNSFLFDYDDERLFCNYYLYLRTNMVYRLLSTTTKPNQLDAY